MSKDITKADPMLQKFIPLLQTWYGGQHPGLELHVLQVDRTPAEQLLYFCQDRLPETAQKILSDAGLIAAKGAGRVTEKDGYNMKSKHNTLPLSSAVDVVVAEKVTGHILWDAKYYSDLGQGIFLLGYSGELRWGGLWQDFGHIEVR